MCLPQQGATPMDFKSSSDQAAGTGFVCENQERKSFLWQIILQLSATFRGEKVQN